MNHLTNTQLNDLATQYGTPLYVYNAESIQEQYKKLTSAFKNCNAKIFYAN